MPNSTIKAFARKSGESEEKVEQLWQKAKNIADDVGHTDDYNYIAGILKKMLGLNEVNSFKEFIGLKKFK